MAADLPPFVVDVAAWLVTYALHSTVLLLAALIGFAWIGRAARRSTRFADAAPAWRENVGRVALLAGVVTASVQTALEIEPFGLRPALVERTPSPVAARTLPEREPAAVPAESPTAPRSGVTPFANVPVLLVPVVAAYLGGFDDVPATATRPSGPEASPADAQEDGAPAQLARVPASPTLHAAAATARPAPDVAGERAANDAHELSAPPTPIEADALAATTSRDAARDPRTPWIAAFVGLWAAVALLAFARRVLGWRALEASLAGAEPVADASVRAEFDRICARAGLSDPARAPRLLVAPLLAAPVTRGIRRHDVCVPPRALTDLDDDERSALFGHEVAHARRRDPAWLALHRTIEVLFCLQPLNRVVTRRLEDDAELLCDDRAVVWTEGRLALASCLTEVASWLVAARGTPRLAAPMAAQGVRLTRRVERIVDDAHAPDAGRRRPLLAAGTAALAAGAIVVVPGFAGERASKPLPLDLQLEMLLTTAPDAMLERASPDGQLDPAVAESLDPGADAGLADASAPILETPAASSLAEDPTGEAGVAAAPESGPLSTQAHPTQAHPTQALSTQALSTQALPAQARPAPHPAVRVDAASGPVTFPSAPAADATRFVLPGRVPQDLARVEPGPADVDALGALLAELDAEVAHLRAGLDERCGADSLRGDVERLAQRVDGLRSRAALVRALLDASTTNSSPAPTGRTAQDR